MKRAAVVILLALTGCGEPAPVVYETSWGAAGLRTIDHGPYRCVVYSAPYRGGLWCERREGGQP